MKKLLYVLICMLVICACNNNGAASLGTPNSSDNDTVQTDSTKTSDPIVQANSYQPGMLEVEMTDIKKSIRDIQTQMSNDSTQIVDIMSQKIDRKAGYSVFFSVVIGLILLLLIIVLLVKNRNLRLELKDMKDGVEKEINNLKQQLQDAQRRGIGQYKQPLSRRDVEDILMENLKGVNARLKALEEKELKQKENRIAHKENSGSQIMEHNIYFGVNQGNKFTKELAPSDESVAFKGNMISEKEVEFIPLSWDRIKSFNSLDPVVKIKGSTNGSSLKVISKGYAVKKSENGISFWEVVDPVEIKLV